MFRVLIWIASNKSMQFKWVPTTYAFKKKVRKKTKHRETSHKHYLISTLHFVSFFKCTCNIVDTYFTTFFSNIFEKSKRKCDNWIRYMLRDCGISLTISILVIYKCFSQTYCAKCSPSYDQQHVYLFINAYSIMDWIDFSTRYIGRVQF